MVSVPNLKFSPKDYSALLSTAISRSASSQSFDEIVRSIEDDMAIIKEDMEALDSLTAQYQQTLQGLETHRRKARFLKSALSKFSAEIMSSIFEHVCLGNSFQSKESIHAIAIASVCALWREIVLNNKKCWSTFHVCGTGKQTGRQRINLRNLTNLFLQRSRDHTLSMHIDCRTIPRSTLTLLMQEAHRWESVTLIGRHNFFQDSEFKEKYLGANSFPSLACLTLSRGRCDGDLCVLLEQFGNFTTVPGGVLQSLCLLEHLTPSSRGKFPHWKHLTRLELHRSTPDNILDTLKACVDAGGALQYVELVDITVPQQGGQINEPSSPKVTLVALRELSIFLGSMRDNLRTRDLPHRLLNYLTLPALTSLKLHASGNETPSENEWADPEIAEAFFTRSKFPLEKLSFFELGISAKQLTSLLHHVSSSIEILTVVETTSGTLGSNSLGQESSCASLDSADCITTFEPIETLSFVFLQELVANRPSTSSDFLSSLKELHFTRRSGLPFERRSFVDIVRSRSPESLLLGGKKGITPLMRAFLTIRTPRQAASYSEDVFSFKVYGTLRRDAVRLWIQDDDPEGKYEKKVDDPTRYAIENDSIDMNSSGFFD